MRSGAWRSVSSDLARYGGKAPLFPFFLDVPRSNIVYQNLDVALSHLSVQPARDAGKETPPRKRSRGGKGHSAFFQGDSTHDSQASAGADQGEKSPGRGPAVYGFPRPVAALHHPRQRIGGKRVRRW